MRLEIKQPEEPSRYVESQLFPGTKCLGVEQTPDTYRNFPPIIFEDRVFTGLGEYFKEKFDTDRRLEFGVTLIGRQEDINGISTHIVKGFREWGLGQQTDMSVSLNPQRDIGLHIDRTDEDYGVVLGTAHLHPELGAKPSKADFQANTIIRRYLENLGWDLNPFFLIYNAERDGKRDSISVYQYDDQNGGENMHIRHPSIFIRGNMENPNLAFYDPSRKR